MGLGDDIMFLGEAEHIHKKTGKTIRDIQTEFINNIKTKSIK